MRGMVTGGQAVAILLYVVVVIVLITALCGSGEEQ